MLIILNSYYVNYFFYIFALGTTLFQIFIIYVMSKLDKKILYRHIRMLQAFAYAYRTKLSSRSDACIYEVCKLYRNSFGNTEKTIDFLLSDMPLSKINIEDLGIFSINIKLLTKNDIKQYLFQCKEYGIYENFK